MNTEIEETPIVINLTAKEYSLEDMHWHEDKYGAFYTASFYKTSDPENKDTQGVTTNYFEIERGFRAHKSIQIEDLERIGFNRNGGFIVPKELPAIELVYDEVANSRPRSTIKVETPNDAIPKGAKLLPTT